MHRHELPSSYDLNQPRAPHQEIADLLALGLLRLRALPYLINPDGSGKFALAIEPDQSVHANSYNDEGVCS